ncbi:MAG TPA: amino acid ABC transporter permease [Ruminococcaceae bacterium]|jgi:L-cystine transport system permease protein|nr:amino acid ABC transporter permease [Oscillospiraceae bacterium]
MFFNVSFFLQTAYDVLSGIPITVLVVLFSLAVAFPLGLLLAIVREKKVRFFSAAASLYVSFMRGTPMIVQIYVVYNSMPMILSAFFEQAGIKADVFGINPLLYALIVFALNTTAVLCEVFRSALSTVDAGQMEAALTNGLTEVQAYRRIIIPQMMVSASANLCNASIELLKNTSLVFYMTVMDIMGIIKTKAALGYNYFEGYTLAFLVYLVLCYMVQGIFRTIENRMKRKSGRLNSSPGGAKRHA